MQMHFHDCIRTKELVGVHCKATIIGVTTLLHSTQISIYQVIATALLSIKSCMDVNLSCISGLATLEHIRMWSKVDSDFVHGHSVMIFSLEGLHRVVQDEKVHLAWAAISLQAVD